MNRLPHVPYYFFFFFSSRLCMAPFRRGRDDFFLGGARVRVPEGRVNVAGKTHALNIFTHIYSIQRQRRQQHFGGPCAGSGIRRSSGGGAGWGG